MQQPIFVSGQVMLEDGTPPTESVAIERVCGGQSRTEGYTDSKGYFSLELGRRNNGVSWMPAKTTALSLRVRWEGFRRAAA